MIRLVIKGASPGAISERDALAVYALRWRGKRPPDVAAGNDAGEGKAT